MNTMKFTAALGVAAMLTGCAGDMSDLDRFIADTKTKHQGKIDPLPEFPPYETFIYNSLSVRDPFKPQTALAPTTMTAVEETTAPVYSGPRPDAQRRREPLESYPVDSLKMVGLLQQQAQTWGLIRDPDGTIHRVQPGNYAGENHGRIVAVTENRIEIIELVPDGISGWVNRDAQLAMTED